MEQTSLNDSAILAENRALRQQIADLQQQLAAYSIHNTSPTTVAPSNLPITQSVLESFPVPLVIYSYDGTVLAMNEQTEQLFGISRTALVGIYNTFADPTTQDSGFADLFVQARSGSPASIKPTLYNAPTNLPENGHTHENGSTPKQEWFTGTLFPIFEDGVARYVVGMYYSITAQIEAETARQRLTDELQQQATELRTFKLVAENAPDAITIVSLDGVLQYANPAHRAMTRYGDRVIGMKINDFIDPSEIQRIAEVMVSSIQNKTSWSGLVKLRYPDGNPWIAQASSFLLTDENGMPHGTAGIFRDVTAQQAQEQELRTFAAIVENTPDGVFLVDNLHISYANPAFQGMVGATESLVGTPVATLFANDTTATFDTFRNDVLRQSSWQGTLAFRRRNGDTFSGQTSSFVFFDAEGNPRVAGGIVRDLTEQQRAEQERVALQEQVIMAQQATLRELSTPLIPIADDVIAMPLVGNMDSYRAQQVLETLLEGVARHQANVAILDITGVSVVDSQVANALLRAAQAVQLLGAQVVLTGIRPEVAQTLVGLGVDMSSIITRGSLQAGIAYATRKKKE